MTAKKSTRGGARPNSGPKPPEGDIDVRKVTVMLDEETITKLRKAGAGNLSAGIRLAGRKLRVKA